MNTAGHRSSALPRLRFFIINNPSSGTAGRKRVERVIRLLQDGGALVNVRTTSSHGEGCEQARAAALTGRHDAIIAAGGDGTIHDVACGLTGQSCPLGIIPAGTANVFAR
ncbi:MAG TPA: diacylglycerol kinase family lipid kinase, partial [Rhizobiales bacterium]|nr:diacylglycerol kinase family lipid kinase [Hyphomicrobiales bacterium]